MSGRPPTGRELSSLEMSAIDPTGTFLSRSPRTGTARVDALNEGPAGPEPDPAEPEPGAAGPVELVTVEPGVSPDTVPGSWPAMVDGAEAESDPVWPAMEPPIPPAPPADPAWPGVAEPFGCEPFGWVPPSPAAVAAAVAAVSAAPRAASTAGAAGLAGENEPVMAVADTIPLSRTT